MTAPGPPSPPRACIVWNSPTRLADSSIRYERYARGLRALGYDAAIVATAAAAADFPEAVHTVSDPAALYDAGLWAKLRPDLVLIPTWLGMADLLAAIRPHARRIVALSDSDGYVGARVHPRQLLIRSWSLHDRFPDRVRSALWLARQYLWAYPTVDGPMLASCRLCDRVAVCSPGARQNLEAFFRFHGEPGLAERVVVAPYPVDESFDAAPVSPVRADQVVAIGRWGDRQKAALMLARVVRRFVRAGGQSRVVILGSGGTDHFRGLQADHPDQVRYLGVVPQQQVRELMGESRVLLSTSRWESGPIVALEALLTGCTVVGPRVIPGFRQLCESGEYGACYSPRTSRAAAAVLLAETRVWADGRRDPAAIAAAWRGHFTPKAVCEQLLAGW
jgi:glycosyltransferase involved in cell wall biosynthesis